MEYNNKSRIKIVGAREHNLKNITVEIPKDTLTIITGPSGSGKSSLALDILYTEGKRRYTESLSAYARQFLGVDKKPDFDTIEGLCPAIAIEQKQLEQIHVLPLEQLQKFMIIYVCCLLVLGKCTVHNVKLQSGPIVLNRSLRWSLQTLPELRL